MQVSLAPYQRSFMPAHEGTVLHTQWATQALIIFAVGLLAVIAAADLTLLGANVSSGGLTELLGSSFGQPGIDDTFDYVVVGGGTAGNVVAARLALDASNYTVALIEAGSFYEILSGNGTQVPGRNSAAANPTSVGTLASLTAMQITTEPQAGYNNRQIGYTTGITFGGSTATNYGGYGRSTIGAHNDWADEVGDDFWSWENAYPYYKKSCNFSAPDYTRIDPSLNITYDTSAFEFETPGPLHVSYGNFQGPFGPPLAAAMDRQGLKPQAGLNSGKLMGVGTITAAVDTHTATRSSSETSFLQMAIAKSDGRLKIYPDTLAKKIVFDSDNKATGVLVDGNSKLIDLSFQLSARREVIVSAGVRSPQLLMVSGVGPADKLAKLDINVVKDLPGVGQNVWDQPFLPHIYKVTVETNTQLIAGNPESVAEAWDKYFTNQSGCYSGIGVGQALGFEKLPSELLRDETNEFLTQFPTDWPYVNYLPLESSAYPNDLGPDDFYMVIGSTLFATKARGNMTIKISDTADPPVIDPNWLGEDVDLDMAVAAFQRIRDIAFNSTIVESSYSPPANVTTRDEIVQWIKENMSLTYYGSCTCMMGPVNDTMAVVDTRARVHGVHSLRVVDASAFRIMPPGCPMSMVYMLAEKIADSILHGV